MKNMLKKFGAGRYGIEICNTILAFSVTFSDVADVMRTRYIVIGYDNQTRRPYVSW